MSHLDQALIKNFDVITLEAEYNKTINLVESIYSRYTQIESIGKTFFSQSYSWLPSEITRISQDEVKKKIKKSAWHFILEKTQINNFISTKRREELNKTVEENKMPEFTAMNIHNLIQDAMINAKDLVAQTCKEVFDFIRPWNDNHKTNQFSKGMPPKVILPWIMDTWYNNSRNSVEYRKKNQLKDLDNIFHLLDGKGVVKYPGSIVNQIESTPTENKFCETEYFNLKWYKNGNLHIEFKRMDLLNKLGQLATENIIHS